MPMGSSGAVSATAPSPWSRERSPAPAGRARGFLASGSGPVTLLQPREQAMAKADLARTGSTIRCAIYTRKSSDEGLEQEFNSLDAQREAGRKPKLLLLVQIDQKIVPEFFSALMTHFNESRRLRANSDDGAYSFMNTTALKHLRIYV